MVDRRENQLRIPVNTKFTMHTDHCSNQEEIDHVYDQDRKCCIKIHKNRLDGFSQVEECRSLSTHREWRCAKIVNIFQLPGVVCVRIFLCFLCSWQCKIINIYYNQDKQPKLHTCLQFVEDPCKRFFSDNKSLTTRYHGWFMWLWFVF